MKESDFDQCPKCQGRGKVVSLQPLLWLGLGGASLAWICLAFADMKTFWPRGKSAEAFVFAFILGPVFMWAFVSRAILSRKGWFVECSRCRKTRPIDASPEDEPPGYLIEKSIPCPECGYDLRYQSVGGRCPECGARVLAPRAVSRLNHDRTSLRFTRIFVAIMAILLLVAIFISPPLAGCMGLGSLGVLGVSLGMAGLVTRSARVKGWSLTGWTAICYASCMLLFGVMMLAIFLQVILR